MLGAQYQDTKKEIVATLTRSDGTVSEAVVGLQSEKWVGLIGFDKSLSRHWSCSMMYSHGEDRDNLNFVLGYRF
ncbi:MAG: hypothetical protein JRH03_09735 [Deltaproteobacteria bacterium]|nr:hypothetical protein [Deltaproteobacteria bacterium]